MDPADPTTPPPPRLDSFRPGTLIVAMDSAAAAQGAAQAISALSANEPYVLAPHDVLAEDDARQREGGAVTRVYKFLSSFLSDQNALQARYVHLARGGAHIVVAVAREDEQAQAIWRELKARGAHDGMHVADVTFRELI